jgi:hypothetical protein
LTALPTLVFFLIGNAAGAIGDVWVVGWLLREPAGDLCCKIAVMQ